MQVANYFFLAKDRIAEGWCCKDSLADIVSVQWGQVLLRWEHVR